MTSRSLRPPGIFVTYTARIGKTCLPVCIALFAAGCSLPGDVRSAGADTYSVSARGQHADAQAQAEDQAERHCETLGRRMEISDLEVVELDAGFNSATLVFRCLEAGRAG